MRMIPVKTKPIFRHIRAKITIREIAVRMREQHDNPDVWMLESPTPTTNSPWEQTRAHTHGASQLRVGSVIDVVEVEARTRLNAVHDYFAVLRMTMSTRRVYSLYAICRSTIEACAFITWVFDTNAEPAERLLRGLLLTKQSLDARLKALRELQRDPYDEFDSDALADLATAKKRADAFLDEVKGAIEDIHAAHEPTNKTPARSLRIPSPTQRIREMLCDDMGMPHGLDAYHRMSGVAHSESLAIIATWNFDEDKPSIDYYSFLEFLHLAVCSIHFSLERRAYCWGQSYKSAGLLKIIRRLEAVIEGEPDVRLM